MHLLSAMTIDAYPAPSLSRSGPHMLDMQEAMATAEKNSAQFLLEGTLCRRSVEGRTALRCPACHIHNAACSNMKDDSEGCSSVGDDKV